MGNLRKNYGPLTGWLFMVCSGLIMLSLADVSLVLAGDNKVGIIDPGKIVLKSKYALKIKDELGAEIARQQKKLERKKEAVEKVQQRLEEARAEGKRPSVIEEAEDELAKGIRELKWMKEDFDKELVEMDKALADKIRERIRQVLDQFITYTDYCIILEKQRVAAFCDSADVTDEIIKQMDNYRD